MLEHTTLRTGECPARGGYIPAAWNNASLIAPPTILVVDDMDVARDRVVSTLTHEGYHVLEAGNGAMALVESRKYHGAMHVLITDYEMPHISGAQLARALVRERAELRVLVMSSRDRNELPLENKWSFLPKPFSPTELLNHVKNILTTGDLK